MSAFAYDRERVDVHLECVYCNQSFALVPGVSADEVNKTEFSDSFVCSCEDGKHQRGSNIKLRSRVAIRPHAGDVPDESH